MSYDFNEAQRLTRESAAAHNQLLGAMQVQLALFDHLSPAAQRELKTVIAQFQAAYDKASAANVQYPLLMAAVDAAEGSLFAVVAQHEGTSAQAA